MSCEQCLKQEKYTRKIEDITEYYNTNYAKNTITLIKN